MAAEQSAREANQMLNLIRMFGVGNMAGNQGTIGAGAAMLGGQPAQPSFGANPPPPAHQVNWPQGALGATQGNMVPPQATFGQALNTGNPAYSPENHPFTAVNDPGSFPGTAQSAENAPGPGFAPPNANPFPNQGDGSSNN
ncbi:hypothetical protein FRC08_012005 [Ceratobasidium sp. 394]|nr:hypothetical protein FRC08_012005 [Ceratobasidium sp. 394]